MFGVRGAPGNTINHATSYWVGNHSTRVFCDNVDIVSGIGWDKIDPDNPAYRFVDVYRVITNLGVFDFGGPDHTHAGALACTRRGARRRGGRTPPSRSTVSTTPTGPPSERRGTGVDPRADRPERTARHGSKSMRLRTPLTELIGHRGIRSSRPEWGWVAAPGWFRPPPTRAAWGILASATMTIDELATAIAKVKSTTDKTVRGEHPR